MKKNKYQAWQDFMKLTGGGLVAFRFKHPYTHQEMVFKMTAKPKVKLDFKVFSVSVEMQEV